MAGKALSRKSKAITIVPLALVSAAWTASLASTGVAAVAAKTHDTNLPDGSAVPAKAIQAPASVPVAGAIAPSVPNGTEDQVVASASTSGIPSAALSAYQRGAQIMDAADTTCNIPWELIAAIGRVESNHGLYGGNTLTADGVSKPGIYGPELNGKNGTQAIADTDGGELDKDATFDRAVGAMQFIPSTWQVVKVDADGDGQRNPQDIDDAALATAVYLCSGKEDLSARDGQEAAVYRYNHSHSYVDLVLRIMDAYSLGDYSAIPSGTYGGNLYSPSYTTAINEQQHANDSRPRPHSSTGTSTSGGSTSGSTDGGSTSGSGDDGAVSPPSAPSTPSNPVTDTLNQVTSQVTDNAGAITQPVEDTLSTLAEATTFCSGQLSTISDPLGVLKGAADLCGPKVQGMTKTDAAALIPNTLSGVVAWLGL